MSKTETGKGVSHIRDMQADSASAELVAPAIERVYYIRRRGRLNRKEISQAELVPPAHIHRVYHYTSVRNWEAIQREGALKPHTSPINWSLLSRNIPEENSDLEAFWQRYHLVGGVDAQGFDAWKDHSEHERLLEYTSKGTGKLVLVSLLAAVIQGAYILDHSQNSTRMRKELFGEDPLADDSNTTTEDVRRQILELEAQYCRSAVRGFEYDGTFAVPEIWIPHPIDLSVVTVEKRGAIADFR